MRRAKDCAGNGSAATLMKIRLNPVVVDTQWSFHVLSHYFETMDAQLQDAANIDNAQIESKLMLAPETEDWERQDLIQSHHEYYEKNFPKKLRYSFLLLVWSTVETQMKATCDRAGKHSSSDLTLADIRGDSTLSRCRKYLEKVVGIRIHDGRLWAEVQTLQKVRNCIIHANGVLKDVQDAGDRRHMEQYFKRDLGLSRDSWGAIAVAPAYCQHILDVCDRLFYSIFDACKWEPDKQGQIIK